MHLRFIAIVLFSLCIAEPIWAQNTVTGSVQDAKTGEYLPGASLQIEGTYSGTITNRQGHFSIHVDSVPVVLVVRFIGYQSLRYELEAIPEGELRLPLAPSVLVLPEVTVTGEDPGIRIMRRVIEEKQKWTADLKTYVVNAYNRFRLENDTGIVSIWESGTRAFWDRERGVREVSQWQQQTQNMGLDQVLPAALFVMNLYDDNVEIAGYNMMGVTHPDALDFYHFRLEEISARDSSEVYIISVEPKQKTSSGFLGRLSILDGAYAMISASLEPGDAFLFPPPVQSLRASYSQQFSNFGQRFWLPVDFQSELDMKLGVDRLLTFPPIKVRQISRLSDFEVNISLPDSLFESDSIVVEADSLSRLEVRPVQTVGVPLTQEETEAYASIDSTMTLEKAYEPSGIVARMANFKMGGGGEGRDGSRGESDRGSKTFKRLNIEIRPNAWYNRVEEFHGRLNIEIKPVDDLRIKGMAGYSTAPSETMSGGGISFGQNTRINLDYSNEIVPRYASPVRSRFLNSAAVSVGQTDYFDYYQTKGWQVSVEKRRLFSRGSTFYASFSDRESSSIRTSLGKSFLGKTIPSTPNAQVAQGRLQYVQVGLEIQQDWAALPVLFRRKVNVELEHSIGGDALSGGSYWRASTSAFWSFNTFFKRRLLPNAVEFRLDAGILGGDSIPLQRLGIIDGSSVLTTFGTIKTLADRPYEGDRWVLLAWEHSFRTVPFELLGWDWALKRHWTVLVHGAHGYASLDSYSGANRDLLVSTDGSHHELGISLSGLFTGARLDTAFRLDKPGFRMGISVARIF